MSYLFKYLKKEPKLVMIVTLLTIITSSLRVTHALINVSIFNALIKLQIDRFFKEENTVQIKFSEEEQLDKDFGDYVQSWLVPSAQTLAMEPIYVVIRPNKQTDVDMPHDGEEFGYVIDGQIKLFYGDEEVIINKGESFYIKTNKKHYIKNIGQTDATVIWVSCPPNF